MAQSEPFFNKNNSKLFRKSDFDINIRYGAKKELNKTISNVKIRSVSQEIDSNGNPIYEVYEFIAKDVIESDNKII